jgi:hypothetical protein
MKTNRSFAVPRPVVILLVGATLVALTVHGNPVAAEPGKFTPACARLDLLAHAAIEDRGEREHTPTMWLANAGLSYLQARTFCLSGEEGKAVGLYRRIIEGDMSLAAPQMTQ